MAGEQRFGTYETATANHRIFLHWTALPRRRQNGRPRIDRLTAHCLTYKIAKGASETVNQVHRSRRSEFTVKVFDFTLNIQTLVSILVSTCAMTLVFCGSGTPLPVPTTSVCLKASIRS